MARTSKSRASKPTTKSPLRFAADQLRKDSAYGSGRSIVAGTAIINSILQPAAAFILLDDWNIPAKAILSLSIILGWILFHQILSAFFDIADAKLDLTRRNLANDAAIRNPGQ